MSDIVDCGQEIVTALINDGHIEPADKLAGLVLFAAFDHGPRAGVIARRLGADLAVVGEMVERLDAAEYWGPFESGQHRGICAEWPAMMLTDGTDDELVTRCIISFVLDVMVAKGQLTRRRDEQGEFQYGKCAEAWPAVETPAEGAKVCTRCGETKPFSEYYRRDKGTYFSRCKTCVLKESKRRRDTAHAQENPRCEKCGGPRGYGSTRMCMNCYRRSST